MSEEIKQRQKTRFEFLRRLHEIVGDDTLASIDMFEIGKEFGQDRRQTEVICEYLRDEYLLEFKNLGGSVGLTHSGIREIEKAILNPDEQTDHFLPINVLFVNQMTNSQIQQGVIKSNQNQTIQQNDLNAINDLINKIENSLDKIIIPVTQKNDMVANIETIKAQCTSSKPRIQIVLDTFSAISEILHAIPTEQIIVTNIISEIAKVINSLGIQ